MDVHCKLGPPPQPARSDLGPFVHQPLISSEDGGWPLTRAHLREHTGHVQLAAGATGITGTITLASTAIMREGWRKPHDVLASEGAGLMMGYALGVSARFGSATGLPTSFEAACRAAYQTQADDDNGPTVL